MNSFIQNAKNLMEQHGPIVVFAQSAHYLRVHWGDVMDIRHDTDESPIPIYARTMELLQEEHLLILTESKVVPQDWGLHESTVWQETLDCRIVDSDMVNALLMDRCTFFKHY